MRRIIFFLFLFEIVFIHQIFSQAKPNTVDSAKVYRDVQDWVVQPILRLEYLLNDGSHFFAESSIYFPNEYLAVFNEQSRGYLWLGIEDKTAPHWHIGTSLKLNLAKSYSTLIPRFNISHTGVIDKMDFWKEISYEHILFLKKGYDRKGEGRVSITVGFGHKFRIFAKEFYASLIFKPYLNFDYEKDNFSFYVNRKLDRFKSRFDLYYNQINWMKIGLYIMQDTEYYYTLGGVSSTTGPFPDRKVNRITPITGLSLHFILNSKKDETFLTGWPSR